MTSPILIDLPIRGMTCAGCAGRVERALQQVPGVSSASVNLLAERAQVQYQGASPQALIDAITACGYQVPQEALELQISGMSCASCVGRVERALAQVPGVLTVSVNLASERAHLQLLGTADPQALLAAVLAAGYQASLLNAEEPPAADPSQSLQRERWSLLLALGLALPLLLPMLVEPFGLHWMQPAWLQFALATPVQFIFGARFYRAGWSAVRAGSANMDLLDMLGEGITLLVACLWLALIISSRPAGVGMTAGRPRCSRPWPHWRALLCPRKACAAKAGPNSAKPMHQCWTSYSPCVTALLAKSAPSGPNSPSVRTGVLPIQATCPHSPQQRSKRTSATRPTHSNEGSSCSWPCHLTAWTDSLCKPTPSALANNKEHHHDHQRPHFVHPQLRPQRLV